METTDVSTRADALAWKNPQRQVKGKREALTLLPLDLAAFGHAKLSPAPSIEPLPPRIPRRPLPVVRLGVEILSVDRPQDGPVRGERRAVEVP